MDDPIKFWIMLSLLILSVLITAGCMVGWLFSLGPHRPKDGGSGF